MRSGDVKEVFPRTEAYIGYEIALKKNLSLITFIVTDKIPSTQFFITHHGQTSQDPAFFTLDIHLIAITLS